MSPTPDHVDLALLVETAVLASARILPMVSLTPIVGGQAIPRRLRLAIAVAIGVAITPLIEPCQAPESRLPFGLALAKEALIGGVLALTVLVIIEAVSAAGELIDLGRGATFGNTVNPLSQQPISSALSPLFQQSLIATLAATGGLAWVVAAIVRSFELCGPFDLGPVGAAPEATAQLLCAHAMGLAGRFLAIAVLLAAPVLAATFVIELSVAAISRLAPSLQIGGLTAELKSLAALVVVVLMAGTVLGEGGEAVLGALGAAVDLVGAAAQRPPGS